jgi:3-hydroxy-3-methylglutaryl CoA synthase
VIHPSLKGQVKYKKITKAYYRFEVPITRIYHKHLPKQLDTDHKLASPDMHTNVLIFFSKIGNTYSAHFLRTLNLKHETS